MKRYRPKFMAVYKLTTPCNGKVYVGGSRNAYKRIDDQLKLLLKNKHPLPELQKVYNQFGPGSVIGEILQRVETVEQLAACETNWIIQLNAADPEFGYNRAIGSSGVRKYIRDRSPNYAKANVLRWADPEYNERVSEEISKVKRGVKRGPNSPEARARQKAAAQKTGFKRRGVSLRPETCAKMSATRLGKKRGPYKGSKAWKLQQLQKELEELRGL